MSKPSPFVYVKSINKKDVYHHDLSGYVPFLVNRAFAAFIDTIMLSEAANQMHRLDTQLQYDFYYYGVRKGSRFDPIPKATEPDGLEVVMAYFNYSKQKALEAMGILTHEDILNMVSSMDKGGR